MKKVTLFTMIIFLFWNTGIVFSQIENRGVGVKIKDENGKEREIRLYEGSYAIVIGNSNFTNGWRRLPGVSEDIKEVSKTLEQNGFFTELASDVSRDEFRTRLETFINTNGLNPENQLLIYFAGHGYTEKIGTQEVGYIVMKDAPTPDKNIGLFRQKAVEMSEIESLAKRIKAKHALFVFDSCFSGSLTRDFGPKPSTYISDLSIKPVRQFITSGTADQEVPDKSVFREMFQKGLAGEADFNKDDYVTGTELGLFLQQKVSDESNNSQTPQYSKIRDSSLSIGDFIFVQNSVNRFGKELRIISPSNNEKVGERPIVKGKVADASAEVFVLVHPMETNQYWVQRSIKVAKDGTWETVINIGQSGAIDVGKHFEIRAVANPTEKMKEGVVLNDWAKAKWSSQIIEVIRAPLDNEKVEERPISKELQINSPSDNEKVEERTIVKGKVADASAEVFVLVHPLETNKYWVQKAVNISKNGTWEIVINIGQPGAVDIGKHFEIRAVANPKEKMKEGDVLDDWAKAKWSSQIIEVIRK